MTVLFAIAGWFVAGRSWFTNIIAALSIGSLAALGGYVYGRIDGNQAAALRELTAQRDYYAAEIKRRDEAAKIAAELARETAERDAQNKPIEEATQDVIDRTPVIADCVPGGFLDGLRRLK